MREVQNFLTEDSETVDFSRKRKKDPKKSKKPLVIAGLLVGIALIAVAIFFITKPAKTPIDMFKTKVGFNLYYPKTMPPGYSYKQGSAKLDSNIFIYTLTSGGNTITVTQQPAPNQNQSLRIEGFSSVATPIGTMQIGLNQGNPTAIITTSKTLLTIKADSSVSQETLSALAQSLKDISQ